MTSRGLYRRATAISQYSALIDTTVSIHMVSRDGAHIPSCSSAGLVHVIVDTPQGSRNKYKYDDELRCSKLSRVLPMGMSFPHDFGSIPGTVAADGDPLDVLVLVEAPSFVGCVMSVHLIGVIEAEQLEEGKSVRNDRLIAVAETPVNKPFIKHLDDVAVSVLNELEQFFINYNHIQGRKFMPLARRGPEAAQRLLKEAMHAYQSRQNLSN
jgi:Inorganic pyrophosphatase